jgi:hypothetical protein
MTIVAYLRQAGDDAEVIARHAVRLGLDLRPLSTYMSTATPRHAFVLGYTHLDEERIVVALEYVDTYGLPALSMRKLGAHLSVEGMLLYWPRAEQGHVARRLGRPGHGDGLRRPGGTHVGAVARRRVTAEPGHGRGERCRHLRDWLHPCRSRPNTSHEGSEPDLDQHADDLDPAEFPNLTEVIATRAGLDFDARFAEPVDILLTGYAALPRSDGSAIGGTTGRRRNDAHD